MEFLTFIGVIISLVLVLSLRGRVRKLEDVLRSGAPITQQAPPVNTSAQSPQAWPPSQAPVNWRPQAIEAG
ncbi:hypothetical protein HY967_00775, partial [Candidatus Jorgensenbacteria bacterium]|nr:hypothetical protein [Candidatus Jorgensenbacteria bacterium]